MNRYMSQVDKALKAFDYTTEWADLIAALDKLNKVLMAHMKYPIIPRRIVISKRLQQCMHHALPSGVHLKALATYDLIFKCMGTNRLAQELFLYSAGLFPLLGNAAMNVRPTLLTVYETHFVPLGERLRPALNGLLAGVLQGMEEGSDHYARTNRLLESVCEASQPKVFYGSLWECIASNASVRLPAITFLLQHLDRKVPLVDQLQLFGSDSDVVVNAVGSALQDASVLVQRNALDLLIAAFPMHLNLPNSPLLSDRNRVELMTAASMVLLRRDMSLNRRLFGWLLGSSSEQPPPKPSHQRSDSSGSDYDEATLYFDHFSKVFLVQALKNVLQRSLHKADLKPYRLLTSLLDKPEIGPAVIEDVLLDVFRALFHGHQKASQGQELIKNANLLFGCFESHFVWDFCGNVFNRASCVAYRVQDEDDAEVNRVGSSPDSTVIEMCALIDFLLDVVSIETYVETSSEHLPHLFKTLVQTLTSKCRQLTAVELTKSLVLCKKVLSKVQPAWNVWDIHRLASESSASDDREEVAKEATEDDLDENAARKKAHELLMLDCISIYQRFYVEFLKTKIYPESFDPGLYLAKMEKRPTVDSGGGGGGADNLEEENVVDLLRSISVPVNTDAIFALQDAVHCCCQILVELSSIPTVIDDDVVRAGPPQTPGDLPLWLQYLVVSSCLIGHAFADFQLENINTLLEMVDLLESNVNAQKQLEVHHTQPQDVNFVVVMLPMMKPASYRCVFDRSLVPQVVAARLWDGLGLMPPVHHLSCVSLLHHLHNVAPHPQAVERIVAKSLSHPAAVDAFHKFTLFWHLSRGGGDVASSKKGKKRTFDVCLLQMLDNLNAASGPLKTLSQSWLVHALARGDVARIMEPLLITLLDPTTARVSILYCKVDQDSAAEERKIYAISTAANETVHHVSSANGGDNDLRLGWLDRSRSHTSGLSWLASLKDQEDHAFATVPSSVNPFALVPPELDEYDSYTQGYPKEDASSSASSSPSTTPSQKEDVAEHIVDGLVRHAVTLARDRTGGSTDSLAAAKIHPLHSHLLLYTRVSDSKQILYTMKCVKNILQSNPRLCLCMLSTTSLNNASGRSHQIQTLLARHRKSVFGQGFVGELSHDHLSTHRSATLIEVVVSTSLYYLRSYYPNLGHAHLSPDEIQGNREVQLMSIDILGVLVSELILVVRDNGKAYATYMSDLFSRCKVQKVVLHSLLAGVNDMNKKKGEASGDVFTDDVLAFNDVDAASDRKDKISNFSEAFQVQILRLLLSLVILEQMILQKRGGPAAEAPPTPKTDLLRYLNDRPIPDQPMFLAAIVSALRQDRMRHLHSHWTSLVTSLLPFLGKSLAQTVREVTSELCRNLERIAPFYNDDQDEDCGQLPADYVVTQLEALTVITHYCLLDDSSAQQVGVSFNQAGVGGGPSGQVTAPSNEILTNLLHVFMSHNDAKSVVATSMEGNRADAIPGARKTLLSSLPRLVSCAATLWSSTADHHRRPTRNAPCLVGAPRDVRFLLLDLLSPVAHHHSVAFLSAISVAWQERRTPNTLGMARRPLPTCNDQQDVLVSLVGAVRTMPVDRVVQTLRQVLKAPPSVTTGTSNVMANVEVSALQFFYFYLAKCTPSQVHESWSSLAALLRDCLALAPAAVFLALAILNQFVLRSPTEKLDSKKDQKELQELTNKLVDECARIGGSCLEQTTWLRRNLAVKSQLQKLDEMNQKMIVTEDLDLNETSTKLSDLVDDETAMAVAIAAAATVASSSPDLLSGYTNSTKKSLTQYSVAALALLGELLAPLLDIIYSSDEKDKVIPLLCNVMHNVVPYLRNHSRSNMSSFRACCKLLASLSEYQYTRKAWRKEGMELLLDPQFFQIDLFSLQHWRVTVDNLMTHDKTTFKDLMGEFVPEKK